MTTSLFSALKLFFGSVWSLFNGWVIPGTHMTPGEFGVFAVVLVALIRILRMGFVPKHDGGGD